MAERLININIANEMEKSFLDYSMSVIVSRAIPDVRDGLKPVQRRIIYTMHTMGLTADKQYQKSASVVGEALGKYHPHGDSAIYDTLVRMAQPFSLRNPLIDGHGNFGSIDGDSAAAMRYTECKMAKITSELLRDLNKDTVDFTDNYAGNFKEPTVLPSKYPNLLVNGTTGIAVGMATNIPPHNLGEVIDATIAYIDNNDINTLELMKYIKGPDFPTGAVILGNSGIKKAYETGRGIIQIRSVAEIVEKNNRNTIIVREIPYQVNKSILIQKIAELVRDKKIEGISDLRDESNRNGIRIVIEIKRDANANIVLNNLYKHTSLQSSFGLNMLALSDGRPMVMSLKTILEKYVDHQKSIIIRRSKFELSKAENRVHILEGFKIALDNIDEIIKLIKSAKNDKEALNNLQEKFKLSEIQTTAILEMKLRRLTGLERGKIEDEYNSLISLIKELKELLGSTNKILELIKSELLEIKTKYNDNRRSIIDLTAIDYIEDESLIEKEEIIISMTTNGYIKRLTTDTYRTQNRGGVGIKGITTNEEDDVLQIVNCTSHDYVYLFSSLGKVYKLKGYEIPEFNRVSKGLPLINLLPLASNEKINNILTIKQEENNDFLLFITKKGIVKKTALSEYESIRQNGKKAIKLNEEDELISVQKLRKDNLIALVSSSGKLVLFKESELRPLGRSSLGVKGINLDSDVCIGAQVTNENNNTKVLILTNKGYGKKTKISEYRLTKRGSKGVKTLNSTDKNGVIAIFKFVEGDEDIIITTTLGMTIRINLASINDLGRITQGVKIIGLKPNDFINTATVIKPTINNEPIDKVDVPRET